MRLGCRLNVCADVCLWAGAEPLTRRERRKTTLCVCHRACSGPEVGIVILATSTPAVGFTSATSYLCNSSCLATIPAIRRFPAPPPPCSRAKLPVRDRVSHLTHVRPRHSTPRVVPGVRPPQSAHAGLRADSVE
ncbi:hypothetical protein OH77DRAFT_1106203 [Trametes cingulata]|nr:hypothetical protein OH77DRAFT_1106203 [Trametes cingulata]